MDPLTIITGAIIAGAAAGSSSTIEQAIKDAYSALKSLIKSKFGEDSDVLHAIKGLENKPDSLGRRETLKEELSTVGAGNDASIINISNKLLELLKQTPDGEKHVQQAIGNFIAQADRSGKASVKVHQRPDVDK